MEENGERGSISCKDDNFADTTVQGLGGFVGALLQLTVVGCLLDNVENFLSYTSVRQDFLKRQQKAYLKQHQPLARRQIRSVRQT
jgi:hypothetical protein